MGFAFLLSGCPVFHADFKTKDENTSFYLAGKLVLRKNSFYYRVKKGGWNIFLESILSADNAESFVRCPNRLFSIQVQAPYFNILIA